MLISNSSSSSSIKDSISPTSLKLEMVSLGLSSWDCFYDQYFFYSYWLRWKLFFPDCWLFLRRLLSEFAHRLFAEEILMVGYASLWVLSTELARCAYLRCGLCSSEFSC